MTDLSTALGDYLALRRSVGFKLDGQQRWLEDFIAFLDHAGAEKITTDLALTWATRAGTSGKRLSAVRIFARYVQALDPATEIPPDRILPIPKHRPTPYLYSEAEIEAMMAATSTLSPKLWAATIATALGLLWATGMRVCEVLNIDRNDISFDRGILTVWFTKFGKSRHVPLADSVVLACRRYADLRDRMCPRATTQSFFVSKAGARLGYVGFRSEFIKLLDAVGITGRPAGHRPRIHDLRHSFAVRTILEWYRIGEDVQALLPRLSTYLGHSEPRSTYWYLSAAPELMALAATRLESSHEAIS